jgi:glycine cleavage system H lipoate-binding protein
VDKSKLLAKRAGNTREVELPNVGTVTVRGLTKIEVEACKGASDATEDVKIIATGLVDPELTEEEVAQWLGSAPAGEYVAVMTAITELSGLAEGAAQKSVPRARGRK